MRARRRTTLTALTVASLWPAGTAAALALSNPASVYCEQRGGRIEIERTTNGAERGICLLQNGTRIDEWAYFRNAHRTTH